MFKALFSIIINMCATIIQVAVFPINQILNNYLPDVSTKILEVTTVFNSIFNSITWALGLLPNVVIETLLFIVTVEIAKHTIKISTHTLIKVWIVLQKVKFW